MASRRAARGRHGSTKRVRHRPRRPVRIAAAQLGVTRIASQYREDLPLVRSFDIAVGCCPRCRRRVQCQQALPSSWTAAGAGARGGELDGESHTAAVRGSATFETRRAAQAARKPAVHLVGAETDDRIAKFRRGSCLQAAVGGAQPPTRRRMAGRWPSAFVFETWTVTMTSPPSANSTSDTQKTATWLRRSAPVEEQRHDRGVDRTRRPAVSPRSTPLPVRRGRRQVAPHGGALLGGEAAGLAAADGAAAPAPRRKPSRAWRMIGPPGDSSPASRAARRTAVTASATIALARPVRWRCPQIRGEARILEPVLPHE